MDKNKKITIVTFILYLLVNPLFIASYVIALGFDNFTDMDKFALGAYFFIWCGFGIYLFIYRTFVNKKKKPEPVKTIDQLIDECWENHKKEKEKGV